MIVRSAKYINPYKLFVGSFVPNWLMQRPEVSAGAKLTYARLLQYAGKDGRAFPAVETLADELGLKTRMTQYHLTELSRHDLIDIQRRALKTSVYFFRLHKWMEIDAPEGVQDIAPQGAMDCTDSVQDVAPSSLRESSEEDQVRNPPLSPKGGKRVETPWPVNFALDADMARFAQTLGINPETEFESWRDDCAAHGRRYIDWKAAWRTRCRNYQKFGVVPKNGRSTFDVLEELHREALEKEGKGGIK